MTRLQRLLLGVSAAMVFAAPALAETPVLPPCKAGGAPVTLVIRTDTTSGWTVNGVAAVAVSHSAWANPAPATWIGPAGGKGPQTMTYKITFNTPNMHGPMTVSAKWAADNCGKSLQAGGTTLPIPATACAQSPSPNGMDFLAFNHVTNVAFQPADSNSPTASITFTVENQPSSATGFAAVFTVTSQCVCR